MFELLAQTEIPLQANPDGSIPWVTIGGIILSSIITGVGFWYKERQEAKKKKAEYENELLQKEVDKAREIEKVKAEMQAELKKSEHQVMIDYYRELKEQNKSTFEQMAEQIKVLIQANADLNTAVAGCRDDLEECKNLIRFYEENPAITDSKTLLEQVFNNVFSGPAWIHDMSADRWYLNDEYCRFFSVQRSSFWQGINILGMYSFEQASEFIEQDERVLKVGAPIVFTDEVRKEIANPQCTQFIKGTFKKTPIIIGEKPYVIGKMLEELPQDE